MANFNINQTGSDWSVALTTIDTDCTTTFVYTVSASQGDIIDFRAIGQEDGISYTLNDEIFDNQSDVINNIVFLNNLQYRVSIPNSGVSGSFLRSKIIINNNSSSDVDPVYTDYPVRENDSANCNDANKAPDDYKYDDLADTPDNKVGKAGYAVVVSQDESSHEYIPLGSIASDLNYTHVNASNSLWSITHGLGKIPSVMIQDGLGNTIHGDISYTDLNSLTVTFNTAFAGTAYLN
tara:strand:- start:2110 stop:2817 length:708 start_codon:yes stop_codon:yes gene_type:complete